MANFEGEQGNMLPCPKVVFAYKVAASAAGTVPGMTYVLLAGGDGFIALERKPLEDALVTTVRLSPFALKGKQLLLSAQISLFNRTTLIHDCFSAFSRQFMQIRCTPNILSMNTT